MGARVRADAYNPLFAMNWLIRGVIIVRKYRIQGGTRLSGAVDISGAKNAVVAILPAALLADEPCRIENIPNIKDVYTS